MRRRKNCVGVFFLVVLLATLICVAVSSSASFWDHLELKKRRTEAKKIMLEQYVAKHLPDVLPCSNETLGEPRYKCLLATNRGRRPYQEDRILCDRDMIPFHGYGGTNVVFLDLVAVFDGHIGTEASEYASRYFISTAVINAYSINRGRDDHFMPWINYDRSNHDSFCRSMRDKPYVTMDEANHMEILRYALVSTFKEIDDSFVKLAVTHDIPAGTTALVALLVDGHILVAHVGDSKALLCSEDGRPYADGVAPHLSPKELTRDHSASRAEEKARIEAAGGFLVDSTVPLVMGHFPMTRAIGDLPLKRYGIISEPEVIDWQPLSANDSFLVVASDGIFESLTPNDVCNLLSHEGDKMSATTSADRIIQKAYEKGTADNLSVVVVPLR